MTARKTVLHADDVQRWRDLVHDSLSPEYNVVSVTDCDAVLPRLRQGGVDLVILDHLMPGEDPVDTGFEVCQQIRRHYPQLPVLVFTGAYEGVGSVRSELEATWGARFLDKSTDSGKLRKHVDELLGIRVP